MTFPVEKIDSLDLRNNAFNNNSYVVNKDSENVYYSGTMIHHSDVKGYFLVNTSGTIQKTKSAAKDGNDWYFYVKNKQIKMYTNNSTLKGVSTTSNKTGANALTVWESQPVANGYIESGLN